MMAQGAAGNKGNRPRLGHAMVAARKNRVGDPYEGGRGNGQPQANAGTQKKQGGAGGFHPYKILKELAAGETMSPEQLTAAAKALTVLGIRPEVKEYGRIGHTLEGEKAKEAEGLANLGNRTAGNVSDYYKGLASTAATSLANQQAIGSSLSAQSANIAKHGQEGLSQMQSGALGDYQRQLEMRGSEGTAGQAQGQLDDAVKAQQAAVVGQGQTAQQSAASQSANTAGLLAAMGGAEQIQGGETVGGIRRSIANRVAESNSKYNTGIKEAHEKQAEAKNKFGPEFVKNLLGLREGEQKFLTSEQAVAGKKAELGLKESENAEAKSQQALENEENALKNSVALKKLGLEFKEFGLDQWKAHHPNAGKNEQQKKQEEFGKEVKEVKSSIGSMVAAYGAPKTRKQLAQLIIAVNGKVGANPQLVSKVLHEWWLEKYPAGVVNPW